MFDYFYGNEPQQYAYYSVPQVLFTDERFSSLSCESKLLYGIFLSKAGLSLKNKWIDDNGRVYIYFKREDICQMLGIKKDKAIRLLKELDEKTGIGLIKRVNQGQGKPTKIFVKHFARIIENDENSKDEGFPAKSDKKKNVENFSENESADKTDFLTSENPTSGSRENRHLEVGKTDALPLRYNKRDILSDISYPIYQESEQAKPPPETCCKKDKDMIDRISYTKKIEEIHERIYYENILELRYSHSDVKIYEYEEIDELVELIAWAELTSKPMLKINGELIDTEMVRERFAILDSESIMYVLDCLNKNTVEISMRRNYLLTCLYNAPSSISGYYQNLVNHDMYG